MRKLLILAAILFGVHFSKARASDSYGPDSLKTNPDSSQTSASAPPFGEKVLFTSLPKDLPEERAYVYLSSSEKEAYAKTINLSLLRRFKRYPFQLTILTEGEKAPNYKYEIVYVKEPYILFKEREDKYGFIENYAEKEEYLYWIYVRNTKTNDFYCAQEQPEQCDYAFKNFIKKTKHLKRERKQDDNMDEKELKKARKQFPTGYKQMHKRKDIR